MSRLLSWLDAALAALGDGFIRGWTRVERSYRRPAARLALRLKFAFYPLLALGAIAWLAWDWNGARSLDAAENAIFDRVVQWRPYEPAPSGRVVVVEIDECSIEYFRGRGEGGWPWSRERHADLLDQLDRAGAAVVGYDVLFADPSQDNAAGDQTLEAIANGGAGRFFFAATRMHPDYDDASPLRASQAPSAFRLTGDPQSDPKVALLLPYGAAMARNSAIVNVRRDEDGIMRDIPLYEAVGGWAIPSLPLRLATAATGEPAQRFPASVRPDWRKSPSLAISPRTIRLEKSPGVAPPTGSDSLPKFRVRGDRGRDRRWPCNRLCWLSSGQSASRKQSRIGAAFVRAQLGLISMLRCEGPGQLALVPLSPSTTRRRRTHLALLHVWKSGSTRQLEMHRYGAVERPPHGTPWSAAQVERYEPIRGGVDVREHTNRKWLLKVGPLVAVGAAVLIGCSGGASDTPSESMARAILEASGAVKSGALKIDSFTKTNGLKREQNGVEQYEFDYKVEVSFPKGVMPQCVDTSHFDLVCNSASISGMKPKKVGAQETHTGKILFEKAENGWRSVSHEPDDA